MAYLGRKGQTAPLASADLPTNSISTDHLIANSVTSAKIGVDVIVAEDIANNAVTVAELSDNAVTQAKLADNAVGTAEIADDAVTGAKLANDRAISTTGALTGTTGDFNWDSNTLVVDSSESKVGIGIAAPLEALHIEGTSPAIKVHASNEGGQAEIKLVSDQADDYEDTKAIVSDNNGLHFKNIVADAWVTNLFIDNSGKVGIGTDSPGANLQVEATAGSWGEGIRVTSVDSVWGGIKFQRGDGTGGWHLGYLGNSDNRVGVHTAESGNIMILHQNGAITNGANSATWHSGSDIKLKKEIVTIENALDKVNALRGVSFLWKKDSENKPNGKREYGFVAQEVDEVIPDLVHVHQKGYTEKWEDEMTGEEREPRDELLGVDDRNGFEAIIVEAVKELSAKVTALENA